VDIQRIDHSCGGMSVRVDGFYTACVFGRDRICFKAGRSDKKRSCFGRSDPGRHICF